MTKKCDMNHIRTFNQSALTIRLFYIENVATERPHGIGMKNNNRSRPLVAQFSFYKDKMNILRNCKKLKSTRFSIFEEFSRQTTAIRKEKWHEVLTNREKGTISYLNYRNVICTQRVR